MSCNGCQALRKGCDDDCIIRPCLKWIKKPESQANATLFLCKFYGRAGLLNLINAGPKQLRPAIFRSLLEDACGRMIRPIHGAAGLYLSGEWRLVQDAVDAVLNGVPIDQLSPSADGTRYQSKSSNLRSIKRRNGVSSIERKESGPESFMEEFFLESSPSLISDDVTFCPHNDVIQRGMVREAEAGVLDLTLGRNY